MKRLLGLIFAALLLACAPVPHAQSDPMFLGAMYPGNPPPAPGGIGIFASDDGKWFENLYPNSTVQSSAAHGQRDPDQIFWWHQWAMLTSYGDCSSPNLRAALTPDLGVGYTQILDWAVASSSSNNCIDMPTWVPDTTGLHVSYIVDNTHALMEVSPLNPDPATWGSSGGWSSPVHYTDIHGANLVQADTSVIQLPDNSYLMGYFASSGSGHYLRTSQNRVTGWSDPIPSTGIAFPSSVLNFDSEKLVLLPNNCIRWYIGGGNTITYSDLSYFDNCSRDLVNGWGPRQAVKISGFSSLQFNWGEYSLISDPEGVANIRSVLRSTTGDRDASGGGGCTGTCYVVSVVAQGSTTSAPNGSFFDVTYIDVPAGTWDINGVVGMNPGSGTTGSAQVQWVNTVSATLPAIPGQGGLSSAVSSANGATVDIPPLRVTLTSTTRYYLTGYFLFSGGTAGAFGNIVARKVP